MKFFKRDSGGGLILASYHPYKKSLTWHWCVTVCKYTCPEERKLRGFYRSEKRTQQWHDVLHLFGWRKIYFSFQDYHKDQKK